MYANGKIKVIDECDKINSCKPYTVNIEAELLEIKNTAKEMKTGSLTTAALLDENATSAKPIMRESANTVLNAAHLSTAQRDVKSILASSVP